MSRPSFDYFFPFYEPFLSQQHVKYANLAENGCALGFENFFIRIRHGSATDPSRIRPRTAGPPVWIRVKERFLARYSKAESVYVECM